MAGATRPRGFTETWLRTVLPGETRQDFTEPGRTGFMLRLWPGGQKTWVYRYHFAGRQRVMRLGDYPAMSLAEAHAAHALARQQFMAGTDPLEQKRAAQEATQLDQEKARTQPKTVDELVGEYLARGLVRRDGKPYAEPEQVSRLLRTEVLGWVYDRKAKTWTQPGGRWSGRRFASITGRDAVALCIEVETRGSPGTARALRRELKRMFAYAVENYLLDATPVERMKGGKSGKRKRALRQDENCDELARVWALLRAPGGAMARETRLALAILLATGQRAGELCGARWSDVVLEGDNPRWRIPAENVKTRREHTLPLSRLAVELFGELRAMFPASPFVIPARRPFNGRATKKADAFDLTKARDPHSLSHAVRESQAAFGVEAWTPHDLRRTVRSHMARLRVAYEVAERVLNHSPDEIAQVYDQHNYQAEMRDALERWGQTLSSLPQPAQNDSAELRAAVA